MDEAWWLMMGVLKTERERHGFVAAGTVEADPRAPGPPTLLWGRKPDGELWVRILDDPASEYELIDADEWRRRWPHAPIPEWAHA